MTIQITIKNFDGTTDMEFTSYQEAIHYLDALENSEIDEKHSEVMSN